MPMFHAARSAIAAALSTLSAMPVQAAETAKFDAAALAAAQATGRPILVEVAAWWCPVCASQGRTIKAAIANPIYAKLLILRLDYDSQKEAWRKLGAIKQGTLIAFRGKSEVGRIVFKTDKQEIGNLLASTIK